MTSVSHEPRTVPRWSAQLLVTEMWASLAIIAMWVSVLACSLWGPDIVTHDVSGSNATIPSGVALGLFAFFGTWVVARYGFRREPKP